jgi:hypothetical protein
MQSSFYRKFIDFLVDMYAGTIQWQWGKWYFSAAKPAFGIFILIWGLLKLFVQAIPEGMTWFAWWDYFMVLITIPQFLAAMTMFAVNEQKRLDEQDKNSM